MLSTKTEHKFVIRFASCLAIVLSVLLDSPNAESRLRVPEYFDLVRSAELIVIGEILEVRATVVVIQPQEILKGTAPENGIEISLSQEQNWEMPRIKYEIGDLFLIFSVIMDENYELAFGNYGAIELERSDAQFHVEAIRSILAEEETTTPEGSTAALIQMLELENNLARISALRIIYRELHGNKINKDLLVEPVRKATESEDPAIAGNAILVLTIITDYPTLIPILIASLASPHANVASSANLSLKMITREDFAFDAEASDDIRSDAIHEWEKWWEENRYRFRK